MQLWELGTGRSEGVASGVLVGWESPLVSRARGKGGQSGTCLSRLPLTSTTWVPAEGSWRPVLQTCPSSCTELEEGEEGDSLGPERLRDRLLLHGCGEGEGHQPHA